MPPTGQIYLDHNATTPPTTGVIEAVTGALRDHWANPSSVHRPGQAARAQVELARGALAELIGASPRDCTLTSGATEALDLAVRGLLGSGSAARLVTTGAEHAALRDLGEALAAEGVETMIAPVERSGLIHVEWLRTNLKSGDLLATHWANNETGVIQPVETLAALVKERGALLVIDATQWIGKCPASVVGPWCDCLAFSAHKFHGPKGVGVLWGRPGRRVRPRLWGAQELGRRGGTENVPGITGAGAAAREATAWLKQAAERDRLGALRGAFEQQVCALCPGAEVNAAGAARLWNTSNIGFPKLEAEAIVLALSERGVAVSAGAACSSGSLEPSPVLRAMGVPEHLAHGSIRFSLSRFTTHEDLDRAAVIVAEVVRRLRRSMPS